MKECRWLMTGGDEFDDVGRRWLGSSHMVGRGTADATRLARMADGLTGTGLGI